MTKAREDPVTKAREDPVTEAREDPVKGAGMDMRDERPLGAGAAPGPRG